MNASGILLLPRSGLVQYAFCDLQHFATNGPFWVDGAAVDVIQAPKLEPRIVRYELSDYEWTAIKPMPPNKPRGVRRGLLTMAGFASADLRRFARL